MPPRGGVTVGVTILTVHVRTVRMVHTAVKSGSCAVQWEAEMFEEVERTHLWCSSTTEW